MFETTGTFPLPNKDILSYIFDSPAYDQDQPVYVDGYHPERSISCNQARGIVRQLIAGLRAGGVQPGDCVTIHSFNDIYYCVLVLGIIGSGAIFTGTNPAYTSTELAHHLKVSRAKFLISEPGLLTPLLEAAKTTGISDRNLWVFDPLSQENTPQGGYRSWRELFDHGEQDWLRFDDLKTSSECIAARLFSSGTTGLPKAVSVSHYNLVAQQELLYTADPRPYHISRVVPIPLFHAAAAPSTHVGALASGHTLYMMRRFELEPFLQMHERYQATEMAVVPPMVIAVVMSAYARSRPFLKSVRYAVCGAAPLDKDMQRRFQDMLGEGAAVNQVWGMTEATCVAMRFPHDEYDDTGSVGRPMHNIEIKLVDDHNNDISAYDTPGEICIRGPIVAPGYFDNPTANASSFDSQGWYKTGDIGYCSAQLRKWYIIDRKKELIKVRGFQVAPPELEAVLLSHPQIVDAAVIGVPSERGSVDGESPRAFVVRRQGREGGGLKEGEVKEYLGRRLARFKALTGGVEFVDAIPKNASGKILKRILRERCGKRRPDAKGGAKL